MDVETQFVRDTLLENLNTVEMILKEAGAIGALPVMLFTRMRAGVEILAARSSVPHPFSRPDYRKQF